MSPSSEARAEKPTPTTGWRDWIYGDASLSVLLVSLVTVQFVLFPFVRVGGVVRVLIPIVLSLVMVIGGMSQEGSRSRHRISLALAAISLLAQWAAFFVDDHRAHGWSLVASICFLAFAAIGILGKVLRRGKVTSHRIQGAIAAYLMIGLVFAFAHALVEHQRPDSYEVPNDPAFVGGEYRHNENLRHMVYFSFVTLTTLGYGDVVPASGPARSLATFEALVGQLFLAVLLARLVALQIGDAGKGEGPRESAVVDEK